MNKFIKTVSIGSFLIGATYLIKKNSKNIKDSAKDAQQLFKRLTEQLKDTKLSATRFIRILKKANFNQIKENLNNFNQHLRPQISQMHATAAQMKRHLHRN